jgi:hypothetical protein
MAGALRYKVTAVCLAMATFAGIAALPAGRLLAAPDSAHDAAHDSVQSHRLPDSLSNAEFWKLITTFSEPGGTFSSENFTSNETDFPAIVAALAADGPRGGAYLGVGPEQNFHYIAAIRPGIVFQLDIRRQAIIQHLMYKAIFELSSSRADFISLLFSRARPAGPDTSSNAAAIHDTSSVAAIWDSFVFSPADSVLYNANRVRIRYHLVVTRGLTLRAEDLASLDRLYQTFYRLGPGISYDGHAVAAGSDFRSGTANFATLTSGVDDSGIERSFLASEEGYQFVRGLHMRNLIIPVVADFAGPTALRAVSGYLTSRGIRVSAFYVSNVEQYLFREGLQQKFYDNVATLPLDSTSVFIRPDGGRLPRLNIVDGVIHTPPAQNDICPIQGMLRMQRERADFAYVDALSCRS